jgi:hypothetical protein
MKPVLWLCAVLLVVPSCSAADESPEKTKALSELITRLDGAPRESHSFERRTSKEHYEAILLEIVRLGGAEAEKLLRDRLNKQQASQKDRSHQENLELLTALRRVQGKADPLQVSVTIPDKLKATTKNLPSFAVALKSMDYEKIPVWTKYRGDYRSGREARWRFEVRDGNGKLLPVRPREGRMGGGMSQEVSLPFQETIETTLPMDSFIDIPKPGKYTVSILYHNRVTIADFIDPGELADLIACRSKPFTLTVEKEPKKILDLKEGSRKRAAELIGKLKHQDEIKIVLGQYGKAYHYLIAPETPEGQLLQMDWQAVPSMLDALADARVARPKKAWIFGLLYTITCERDLSPMKHEGTVSGYRAESGPGCWSSSSGGKISPSAQQQLISKWMEWRQDYLDVREATLKSGSSSAGK